MNDSLSSLLRLASRHAERNLSIRRASQWERVDPFIICSHSLGRRKERSRLGIAIQRHTTHTERVCKPLSRGVLVAIGMTFLVPALAGCVHNQDDSAEAVASAPYLTASPSSTQNLGCPDIILQYAREHGISSPAQLDSEAFGLPEAHLSNAPDCYLLDETEASMHHAAVWLDPPDDLLSTVNSVLTDAGYRQSADYGPYTWLFETEILSEAPHVIQSSTQPLDESLALWLIW